MRFDDWATSVNHGDAGWKELGLAVKKLFPWTEYVIEIDDWKMFNSDVKSWCKQNLIGRYDISVVSYFEFEEDSVLFALRW